MAEGMALGNHGSVLIMCFRFQNRLRGDVFNRFAYWDLVEQYVNPVGMGLRKRCRCFAGQVAEFCQCSLHQCPFR